MPLITFRHLLLFLNCIVLTLSLQATDAPSAPGKPAAGPTPDLRALLDAEIAKGSKRIVIPPGRYPLKPVQGRHLQFRNLNGVEIVAEGVELVCTATVQAVGFEGCDNVTLRGLTIDYDPLPFTQGKIVALGPDKGWVEFELFDGYPDDHLEERIEIFDPATRELRRASHYGWGEFERTGPRRYRISKGEKYRFRPTADTEELGDLLVTNNRTRHRGSSHAVLLTDCTNMTLLGVTVFAAPSFGFLEVNCSGSTYRRCRVDRRAPGDDPVARASPRLRSLNADAFHSQNAVKGPAILECFAHWQGDDCVNIHGHYYLVTASQGATLRILAYDKPVFLPGDEAEFLPFSGAPPPPAKVVSLTPSDTPLNASEQALLRDVKLVEIVRDRLIQAGRVYSLVLDRDAGARPGSAVCAASRIGSGFAVKDCDFGNNRSRGIIVKAGQGEVTGNRVHRSRMAALLISPEFKWLESGRSSDVVIRGNTFTGIGQTPIQINAAGGDGKLLPAGTHRNLSLLDNRFEDCPWPLVEADSVKGLTISGNVWPKVAPTPGKTGKPAVPLRLLNCEETDIRE